MAGKTIDTPDDLTEMERQVIEFCLLRKEDMVYLVDLTTAMADLPKTLQGQWFDNKLLSPRQKEVHKEAVKETMRALRRLFKVGFVDLGNEESFPEGFRRHHREIMISMQSDARWHERTESDDQRMRFHKTWAEATDFAAVKKRMDAPIELAGLTERGRSFADGMISS
jgi:hypothetical protein